MGYMKMGYMQVLSEGGFILSLEVVRVLAHCSGPPLKL